MQADRTANFNSVSTGSPGRLSYAAAPGTFLRVVELYLLPLPVSFETRNALLVCFRDPRQRSDGSGVLIGYADQLRDSVRNFIDLVGEFADLAVV